MGKEWVSQWKVGWMNGKAGHRSESTYISGVTWPTMKLFIQLAERPRAMPTERQESGQTSAVTTKAMGPQEKPKTKAKILQTNTDILV